MRVYRKHVYLFNGLSPCSLPVPIAAHSLRDRSDNSRACDDAVIGNNGPEEVPAEAPIYRGGIYKIDFPFLFDLHGTLLANNERRN